jgi:hypothetical protein
MDCHGACISESDCCPKPDQETCQGKCDSVENNCGDPVDCGGCPQGQTCDDGTCTSSSGTCGPADCGPPSDFNDLILVNGQCQCKADGFGYGPNSGPVGICQRNASCSAFCAPCCPGGLELGDPCGPDGSGLVCVSDEGPFGVCDCPEGQQFCSGTGQCYTHINECCPAGGVNGNFSPCALGQRCCNGVCTGGCAPGFGGCNFYPCDDGCNPCTQDAPLCCGLGPPTHGTICVAEMFCPNRP